jgi:hypothetical protein
MMTQAPTSPPSSGPGAAAAVLERRLCRGWITDHQTPEARKPSPAVQRHRESLSPRRRCNRPLDPALIAAGIGAHPECAPGKSQGPPDEAVAVWLAGMTPEGIPGPDPWAAHTSRREAEATAQETAETAEASRRAAWVAEALTELDRLAAHPVTGATLAARPAPPRRPRPDPWRWPPGTIGDAARRSRRN